MSSTNPSINEQNKTKSTQKPGKVPSEVSNLYNKKNVNSPLSKHTFKRNQADLYKGRKIDGFFTRQTDMRKSNFDCNRPNSEPDQASSNNSNVKDTSVDDVMVALENAKKVSEEYDQLIQNDEVDTRQAMKVMSKMNKTMIDMISQLKTAIEKKNENTIDMFTDKLKKCTSFISNEMNHVRKEIKEIRDNDEIECMKTVQSCSRDLKKFWIRFIYVADAENLREKNNASSIKDLLQQLNVPINMSQYPIESFYFQSKRFSNDQLIPEIALCCTFVNSSIASIVKSGIRNFNRALETDNKSHLIRYFVNTDWSYNVRSILKPCNEMKQFNVLDKVMITNDGIKVYHKQLIRKNQQGKELTYNMSYVNSLKKLDVLRRKLKDYNFTVPAQDTYNIDYFKMSIDERKTNRDDYNNKSVSEQTEEYDLTDDEENNRSVVVVNTEQ